MSANADLIAYAKVWERDLKEADDECGAFIKKMRLALEFAEKKLAHVLDALEASGMDTTELRAILDAP